MKLNSLLTCGNGHFFDPDDAVTVYDNESGPFITCPKCGCDEITDEVEMSYSLVQGYYRKHNDEYTQYKDFLSSWFEQFDGDVDEFVESSTTRDELLESDAFYHFYQEAEGIEGWDLEVLDYLIDFWVEEVC